VDGWDFKTYVLGMLFYRFISENLTSNLNEQERKAGTPDFDYARLSDADAEFGRAETVKEKGFYILPSELFANVRARARHDANLNETLSRIFADIEGSASHSFLIGNAPQKDALLRSAPVASSSAVNPAPPIQVQQDIRNPTSPRKCGLFLLLA